MFRPIEVLEPVVSEVEQAGTSREIVLHKRLRGPREEDLTPVPGGTDPRCPMHAQTDVTLLTYERLGRVEAHPDAHTRSLRPFVR